VSTVIQMALGGNQGFPYHLDFPLMYCN